jgi:1-acyl-sn-glycerol-3-phosphate acyltransferase
MIALLRVLGTGAVRVFYRRIVVARRDLVPAGGPVVVVANHPNGLIDPVILRIALGRPLAMLAKSTLFDNVVGRATMRAFDAIPVHRSMDGEDTQKNAATFDRCHDLLAADRWIALFSEGTSHSDPALRPLRTGAARIALSAEAAAGFRLGVRVLPVGLLYEDKATYRSRVAAVVGAPIALAPYAASFAADERGCVRELTDEIDRALGDVVLEADSADVWHGLLAVAAWTAPDGGRDLVAREARARRLAGAFRDLAARDPARADAVAADVRRFARQLAAAGIADPFLLDAPPEPARFVASLSLLALLLPLALAGAVLGWLPYRLIRPAARRLAGAHTDLVSTYKVLLGFVVLVVTYAAEALAAGAWLGWPTGVATLFGAPALGLLAVWFAERVRLRREALSAWWRMAGGDRGAREILARRRELCARVDAALRTDTPS